MLVDSFDEGAGDRSQSGEAEPQFDQQGHGIHWGLRGQIRETGEISLRHTRSAICGPETSFLLVSP